MKRLLTREDIAAIRKRGKATPEEVRLLTLSFDRFEPAKHKIVENPLPSDLEALLISYEKKINKREGNNGL